MAGEAGADLLGFIFYEPSPRYVAPETVNTIINEQLERVDFNSLFVGVFVNESPETVRQVMDFCRLDGVQLHGAEPPEFVGHFQGRAYKALRPQSLAEAESLIANYYPRPPQPSTYPPSRPKALQPYLLPAFLLDAYHPSLYGGTGHVTDWTMAASIARRYRVMLAGSLTPANVAEAIRTVQPWGVDVSSGVEVKKGKKDHEKVRAFVRAVRAISVNSKA